MVALAFLSGCGAATDSGSHASQRRIDPEDQHWVELMLLQEDDLPSGWVENRDQGPNTPDHCEEMDFSDLVITGESDIGFFKGDGLELQNGNELYDSEDQAQESLARGNEDELAQCFSEILKDTLSTDPSAAGVSIGDVNVDELEPMDVGDESRVFQITWDLVAGDPEVTAIGIANRSAQSGQVVTAELYLVAFRHGRAVPVIGVVAVNGSPPNSFVKPLAQTIDNRMNDNPPPDG